METQETLLSNLESNEGGEISSNGKKEIKRSASYPALTLTEAYNFAQRINDKFSAANDFTREELATLLNLHPNGISRDIAACSQYGFLSKKEGKGKYQLTSLFVDIFRPESEKEKKLKLITAFGHPKLYQELIQKFDGNVIPEELANTLIKHHGITEAASKDAADTFIKSAQEAGVMPDGRVLKFSIMSSVLSKTQYAEIIEETPKGEEGKPPQPATPPVRFEAVTYSGENDIKVPIHLTKNKMAFMVYPSDINDKDIKLLDHAIQGILLRLELEKDSTPSIKKEEE